jgi:hypothetical protein
MMKLIGLLVVSVLLVSCGNAPTVEVTETRTVATPAPAPEKAAATCPASSMGNAPVAQPASTTPQAPATCPASTPGGTATPMASPGGMPPGHPSVSPYAWTVPEGWTEAPPTSMRVANLKLTADPSAECYAALLQGVGGGVDANINRWRNQLGQPELKPEEIAALPKIDVLGKQCPFVEISGNYTDMSGKEHPGAMLYGAVCVLENQTLFIKMTGPEAVVRGEKDRFTAFCASLKQREAANNVGAQENK